MEFDTVTDALMVSTSDMSTAMDKAETDEPVSSEIFVNEVLDLSEVPAIHHAEKLTEKRDL